MDLLRSAALGPGDSRNRAFTLRSVCGGRPRSPSLAYLMRACAPFTRGPHTWVLRQGQRIDGLASCGPRSGVPSWEINLLCVRPDGYERLPDLLDALCHIAATHGGQRVFLRVAPEDPVVDAAKLGGFSPALAEVLYVSHPEQTRDRRRTPIDGEASGLRRKVPADDYSLFRLHNASTPLEVRASTGMTFEQWSASNEPLPGRRRELVLDDGGVNGWLSTGRTGPAGVLAAAIQPGWEDRLPVMVQQAVRTLRGASPIYGLVPEHQTALRCTLERAGFRPEAELVTVARSLKARVRDDLRAGATVAPG